MRKTLFVLSIILALAVGVSACSAPAVAQNTTPQIQTQPIQGSPALQAPQPPQTALRTISVSGTGKATLSPDIAYIYLGVHTENSDAAQAVAANNTQAQKVKDALKGFGVDDKDIQTTNFSIYPNQQYDKDGKLQGIVYMVDNTIYVKVRDLTKIGDLVDGAVKAGANNISNIQFDVADRTAALSDARKAAIADAHKQADELAQAAGVTLGDVQSINTSVAPTPVPINYDVKGMGAAASPSQAVPVSPGQLTITVDVSMVYLIK